jgi:hypothetical protein
MASSLRMSLPMLAALLAGALALSLVQPPGITAASSAETRQLGSVKPTVRKWLGHLEESESRKLGGS